MTTAVNTNRAIIFALGVSATSLGLYLTKKAVSKNRKKVPVRKAANSVADSEKFHINVAAGASVSIPISAQGDIDIKLGSGNGGNHAPLPSGLGIEMSQSGQVQDNETM